MKPLIIIGKLKDDFVYEIGKNGDIINSYELSMRRQIPIDYGFFTLYHPEEGKYWQIVKVLEVDREFLVKVGYLEE